MCPPQTSGCQLRGTNAQSEGERLALEALVDAMRKRGCGQQADIFAQYLAMNSVALWDRRVVYDGRLICGHRDMQSGSIAIWSGYNKQSGDAVNWTRTAAHEATHVLFPDYSESQVTSIGRICAGLTP